MDRNHPGSEIKDPRISIIDERLKKIKRIIGIASGKGGVGKTSITSILGLLLSQEGYKVGLLDLDIFGPSIHKVFGIKNTFPTEEKGIIPPSISGIKIMSIAYYTNHHPLSLRGSDVSNTVTELFAVTNWDRLDFLLIDMPPGMGDIFLDTIRLIKKLEFLVISTPSKLSMETVKKLVMLLTNLGIKPIGIIENMTEPCKKSILFGIPRIGEIRFDNCLEHALGHPEKLLKTMIARDLRKTIPILINTHRRGAQEENRKKM